jgi:transcriptional regulator GlxA family with amidase domain
MAAMIGMIQVSSTDRLVGASLSEAVTALLDSACRAIDTDLAVVRRYVEHAAALIDHGHPIPSDAAPHSEQQQQTGGLAPWQMLRVARYIDAHLERGVSNEELAQQARLSRSYFAKAFRRSFGTSPHHYVIDRRIERAKSMMLATPDPLGQIAPACGFSDQAHLARIFHRSIGQTPHAWRREQKTSAHSDTMIVSAAVAFSGQADRASSLPASHN